MVYDSSVCLGLFWDMHLHLVQTAYNHVGLCDYHDASYSYFILSPFTGLAGKVLVAFSLYTNGSKLLSAKRQSGTLGALNGVRFLSMSWVILGHAFAFGALNGCK